MAIHLPQLSHHSQTLVVFEIQNTLEFSISVLVPGDLSHLEHFAYKIICFSKGISGSK